jgi:hypothetical protein
MSLPISPNGLPRFHVFPDRRQQLLEADQQASVSVHVGPDHFVVTEAGYGDGLDVRRICVTHEWASVPLPLPDKVLCAACPVCEWERWLTSSQRERGLHRFREITALLSSPVDLGPQGH